MRLTFVVMAGLGLGLASVPAAMASDPFPVPANRTEMKQVLEDSKKSKPRLPLPAPTAEEKSQAGQGQFGIVNNGRMRRLYIPAELNGGFGGAGAAAAGRATTPGGAGGAAGRGGMNIPRDSDPQMSLDPTFKTKFFWIVSRANNCYYCMGHQEVKLASAGLSDDRIAALDGNWSEFTPAERAAFAFTKKLTSAPNQVDDDDIAALKRYYNENQVLEIILSVAGFNSTNRWTGGLAIPQEEHREFLKPTSDQYRDRPSLVAPLDPSRPSGTMTCAKAADRGSLESRAQVEAILDACRHRTPRLAPLNEEQARAVLPADSPSGPLPQWVCLLARFPKGGVSRTASQRAAEEKGTLSRKLKGQIAWIAARNDRAWYALGHAQDRLQAEGLTADQMFALDNPGDTFTPAERAVFALTKKLTVDPALMTDDDIEAVRKHFSDSQTAEVVHQITVCAFFNRLTEAAGLRLEAKP
ncbi:MAG TPA: hypothetical protein VGZ22_27880 [Isosphaeraceae bacterium]|jgi:alkylhydroperoxidase family enzyme|nr:hypothetical protein [Isosphaeraceae bacterium]